MQLNELIRYVISDIYDGVEKARERAGRPVPPSGGVVSDGIPYVKSGMGASSVAAMVSNVEFEVSLAESTRDGKGTGIGVLLGALTLGGKGSSETERSALSRIRFNVPIALSWPCR